MAKNHSYKERGRKEGNVLFNDALNTFYLGLYDVRHMAKNHSYKERGNLFPISSKGSFICIIPIDRITHTTAFVTPVMGHWLEREIAQWFHHEGSILRPITPWANALTTKLHLAPILLQIYLVSNNLTCSNNLRFILYSKYSKIISDLVWLTQR